MKGSPSVVVWDGWTGVGKDEDTKKKTWEERQAAEAAEEEELWRTMPVAGDGRSHAVDDSSDEEVSKHSKRSRKI